VNSDSYALATKWQMHRPELVEEVDYSEVLARQLVRLREEGYSWQHLALWNFFVHSRLVIELQSGRLTRLVKNPEEVYRLSDRAFEELVAEIILREGASEVTLTKPTRDGGRDILAKFNIGGFDSLLFFECKKYAAHRKVDVSAVMKLFASMEQYRATGAVLVTTSTFTRPAMEFAKPVKHRLQLRDKEFLTERLLSLPDNRSIS